MNEYPLFVPCGNEHLAGVLTLPEGPSRAVVLLLQGHGGPRSQRNRVWTRTARALAERGLASVRMDYPGRGDSTGDAHAALESPPVDEAMAMAQVAFDATGVDRFGVAGYCMGARTAWAIASRTPSCVSLACLYRGAPGTILRRGRHAASRALWSVARRAGGLRRFARRLIRTDRFVPRVQFVPDVAATVASRSVLFLFAADDGTGERMRGMTSGLVGETGHDPSVRTEVRGIPVVDSSSFPTSLPIQRLVVEAVVDWMDETLPPLTSPSSTDGSSSIAHPSIGKMTRS